MSRGKDEVKALQERITLFEKVLAEARQTYLPSDYQAMSEGYLLEIARMRVEIEDILSRSGGQVEAT